MFQEFRDGGRGGGEKVGLPRAETLRNTLGLGQSALPLIRTLRGRVSVSWSET